MTFQKQILQSLIWRGLYFVTILFLQIFLSRYLGAKDAGWVFYLSNNFSFMLILAGLTIENGVNYYASRNTIDQRQLSWFSIAWTVMVACIVFVVLWFYFGRFKDTSFLTRTEYLYFAICYIAGIQLTNFFTVLFYANKNFFLPNLIMVVLNVIVIFFIPKQVGTENTNTQFIIYLYFGYFVVNGLVLALAFMLQKKSYQNITLPSFENSKLLIRYALLALTANVIFFLVYRVDYWFVKKFCNAIDLGNYIQVSKLGQMMLIVPSIISSVVFPNTAGGLHLSEMKDNILHLGRLTTLLYIILFIFLAVAGNWLFPFIYGHTYQNMMVPFLLLIPGIWALSNLSILSAYFGGINRVGINIKGAVLALSIILIGDWLFIPAYGIVAAAAVSSVGYFANFLFSFYYLQKGHAVSLSQYWRISKDDITWVKGILKR
jgi:O-antigen/teichoic acid export membrane protein